MDYSYSTQIAVNITVVVVTYNSHNEIATCLKSLAQASHGLSVQLIIVDNASQDGTIQVVKNCLSSLSAEFNHVEIINNVENLGFTRGVNQGLAKRLGRFLLLLNPDTELKPNTLSSLITCLTSRSEVAIVAPQLLYPDGTIQPSCRRFPKHRDVLFELLGLARLFPHSKIFNGWKMGDFDHQHTREVDQPQGAFLFVRSSALEQVGNLDPRFTMFFSDVDWCQRFKQAGWKILFCAESTAVHHKGASVYKNRARMIVLSHRDFIAYFRKYYSGIIHSILNIITEFFLLAVTLPRLLLQEIR